MKKILILFSNVVIITSSIFIFTVLRVQASAYFDWPSTGYLHWTYSYPNNSSFGHNGLDIWGNTDGTWSDGTDPSNGNGPSWSVHPVSSGQVKYVSSTTAGGGLSIKHSDSLYTYYWHVKEIQVALNQEVEHGTLLGQMNYLPADPYKIVHVHLTTANSNADSSHIDPSPQYDLNLDYGSMGYNIPYGKFVERSTDSNDVNCNPAVVMIINKTIGGTLDCGATLDIGIFPETRVLEGSNVRFYIEP